MTPGALRTLVLAAAAALGALRLAAAAEVPIAIHIHSEKAMFQVLISPGAVGTDSFVLQLMSGDGTLLPAKETTLFLSPPGASAAPLERKAALGADGYWHVADVPLAVPGRWHIRIEAVTVFKKISLQDDFDIPGP